MEDDKAILNDFYNYFLTHAVSKTIVSDYLKSNQYKSFKLRTREPEAINRNEQAKEFAEKLISSQHDLDPEYNDIVNEHFDELLAND